MGWLAGAFALTALLYAAVGFGGGSTYNALLVLAGTDYTILPAIALICNILVVTGGSIRFALAGQVPCRRLWPILALSAPCAWAGGMLPVSRELFVLLLGGSLLAAGMLMLAQRERAGSEPAARRNLSWLPIPIGMAIGVLSGIVGIGGGIFLAPILHLLRWARPRRIAACASVFILVNSVAGLGGQALKSSSDTATILSHWPLFVAVVIGGQIGSHFGLRVLPQRIIRIATALLILYVAARLLLQG